MQLVLLLSVTVWFGGDADPEVAVKEVFGKYDYQRDLLPEPPKGDAQAEWSREQWHEQMEKQDPRYRRLPDRRAARERRMREREMRRIDTGGGGASLLQLLVYVALAIALVTIILSIVRNWSGREAKVEPQVGSGGPKPAAELEAPRSEAEALAAAGRYDEAVHVLLLKTIEALMRTQPGGLPDAWTSREIQHEAPMPATARGPFGELVDTVEQSLFGGLPVDADAFDECLTRFREFEAAYRSARA